MKILLLLALMFGCHSPVDVTTDAAVDTDAPVRRALTLAMGQSNNTGHGLLSEVDPAWAVPSPTVMLYSHLGQNDPPVFSDYTGPLQARANGEFGPELSIGLDISDRDIIKCGVGGTSLYEDWNPTGSWPSADANLYSICLRFAHDVETSTGGQITAIAWSHGEADAVTEAPSLAYGDNLRAFAGLMLDEFPCARFFYYRLPKRLSFSANVRAGQERDATDPWMTMVDVDTLPTLGVHFTSDGYLMLGDVYAAAMNAAEDRCAR